MADPKKPGAHELGAGRYRVTKPFVYRGLECKAGDELELSDAGAGVHHDKVAKLVEPERAPKNRGRAKLEARLTRLLAKAASQGEDKADLDGYRRKAARMSDDELEAFIVSGEQHVAERDAAKKSEAES